jgi:hypothetical protein
MVRGGTPGSVGVAVPQWRQNNASSGSGVRQAGQARAAAVMVADPEVVRFDD